MSDPKKFAVHPGPVVSKNDGDLHYISAWTLVKLYELRSGEYIIWDTYRTRGLRQEDYIHLYPRHDGKYGRPS